MVPVRTCIGCRRQVAQDDVVRLALTASDDAGSTSPTVVWDIGRVLPGRGAWLHPQPECFETAVKRKAFHRAFRQSVDATSLDLQTMLAPTAPDRPPHASAASSS